MECNIIIFINISIIIEMILLNNIGENNDST